VEVEDSAFDQAGACQWEFLSILHDCNTLLLTRVFKIIYNNYIDNCKHVFTC